MSSRVAPFGYPRINGYLLLPEAFRSLSRPSSAPDAKAFPLRSFQLDLLAAKSAYLHLHFALGMGVAASARVVREILVLVYRIMQASQILEIVIVPSSFQMLFHN